MNKFWIILSLLLAGCASSLAAQSQAVLEGYKTVVFDDGIRAEEVRLVAQRELVRKGEVAVYDLANPQVAVSVAGLKRTEGYWFVSFNERDAGSMPYIFMVVVNKGTGEIKFAQGYAQEKHWVLEAAMLRDSLPGRR